MLSRRLNWARPSWLWRLARTAIETWVIYFHVGLLMTKWAVQGKKTPRVKGASDWTRFLIQVLAHRDEPVLWGRSLAPSQETRIMALLPSILCWKQIFAGRAFKLLIQMQGRGTADVFGAADLEETRTRSPSSHSSQPVSFHYHRPGLLPHA